MKVTLFGPAVLAAFLVAPLGSIARCDEAPAAHDQVLVPTQVISLINGQDLADWYTWMQDTGYEDPRGIFRVQPDGTLRISGDGYGGLITRREYANYHLIMEFRWGELTWRNRQDRARDAGVLIHCTGADGGYGGRDGQPGPWMPSLEFQVIEGGTGDLLVLPGKDQSGGLIQPSVTAEVITGPKGQNIWSAQGVPRVFTSGRVDWFGRDPNWKDVLGFRGAGDVESPGQEWTTIECLCRGDELTYLVNGVIVNRATAVQPAHGKILLQTECAEWFVRKLELRPLP